MDIYMDTERISVHNMIYHHLQSVPQGSVVHPLFFNIHFNGLLFLFENTELCILADDTTFFAHDKDYVSLACG